VSVDRNYSVKQACVLLNMCVSKFYLDVKSGKLVAHKQGRRTVVRESSIKAYQDTQPTKSAGRVL
jgi:excisionase family DNA binding protein